MGEFIVSVGVLLEVAYKRLGGKTGIYGGGGTRDHGSYSKVKKETSEGSTGRKIGVAATTVAGLKQNRKKNQKNTSGKHRRSSKGAG